MTGPLGALVREDDAPSPRSLGALAAIAIAAALAASAFTALGVWQLERRVWKLDLIARIEARLAADPAPPPEPAAFSPERDEYRRVRVMGAFDARAETLVQATTELGSGYWVLTPLRTPSGFTVLVNRGFVSPDRRDPATRPAPQGDVTVTGLVRLTEPKGAFLRDNESGKDLWRSRDVAAIAAARGIESPAPYFIDADAATNPGGWPVGGLTVVAFNNNHLVYALTWFSLAAMVLGGFALLVRHELRLRRRAGTT